MLERFLDRFAQVVLAVFICGWLLGLVALVLWVHRGPKVWVNL